MTDDHRVDIEPCTLRVRVRFGGETVADSARALVVRETGYGPVHYFPVADVAMERLHETDRVTRCPYKGEASYWTVAAGGRKAENAAWGYRRPIPAAAALAGHIAFYAERMDPPGVDDGDAGRDRA